MSADAAPATPVGAAPSTCPDPAALPVPSRRRALLWGLAVLAVGVAALLLHASRYLPFVADDALISLRYARRLLDGKGLTWTDGEAVEGYSNLLWILAAAGLGKLGVALIPAVRILGVAGMAAAIAATLRASPLDRTSGRLAALAAGLALAATGPIAVWAIGGLETPLAAGLLAWAAVLSLPLADPARPRGRALVPSALLGLLCLTRPDGPLLAAAIGGGVWLGHGLRPEGLKRALLLGIGPVAAVAGQLAFRLAVYGDWVPNTARAKVAFTAARVHRGLDYLGDAALPLAGLALLALAGTVVAVRRRDRRLAVLVVPLVAWLGYVAAIGGDIFPAHRHLVPAAVLLALAAALGLGAIRWRPVAIAGAVAVLAAALAVNLRDGQNRRAIEERWEWDGALVGRFLKRAFGERAPLLAVDPAGCVPYFSELPSLDMLGLNDAWLARHPPASFGQGPLGHELGDGRYLLSRDPDLVLFCGPGGSLRPCFAGGRELVREPRFRAEWRPVVFEARERRRFRTTVFVRAEGGRLGIRRAPERIEIPGFLFAGRDVVAALDGDAVTAELPAGARARLERIRIPAGTWRVAAEASAPVTLAAGSSHDGATLVLDGPATLDLAVTAPAAARLRAVTLERLAAAPEPGAAAGAED